MDRSRTDRSPPENIRQRLDPQAVDPILKQVALQHLNYLEGTYYEKREF
nr:hypothetical protein [Candidatus Sigynarchaeum springense]